MKKHEFIHGAAIGMAGTLAGVILLQLTGTHVFSVGDGILSKRGYVKKLEYLETLIDENYLGDKEEDQLAEGMYAGFVAGLGDIYSCYYTASEYEEENTYTEGAYVGIGIVLEKNEEGGCSVVECYEGGPAKEAGMEAGDLILSVDGTDVREMALAEVAGLIRNTNKEQVVLSLLKPEATEEIEVTVPLKNVELPAVYAEMLENKVGYIQILQFSGVAPAQFQEAYENLSGQGMEKLLIDLRDNPGGLLNSVCEILEEILPEGLIVYMEDKYGNREEIYSEGEHPLSIPLAVLINGNSASASEIFAGAVKDYGIGTLVGTTTFGKGVVQALQQFEDGSALKLTVANYYTPKGNNINKIGVEPDVEVRLDVALLNRSEYTKEEDNQLQEALKLLTEQDG